MFKYLITLILVTAVSFAASATDECPACIGDNLSGVVDNSNIYNQTLSQAPSMVNIQQTGAGISIAARIGDVSCSPSGFSMGATTGQTWNSKHGDAWGTTKNAQAYAGLTFPFGSAQDACEKAMEFQAITLMRDSLRKDIEFCSFLRNSRVRVKAAFLDTYKARERADIKARITRCGHLDYIAVNEPQQLVNAPDSVKVAAQTIRVEKSKPITTSLMTKEQLASRNARLTNEYNESKRQDEYKPLKVTTRPIVYAVLVASGFKWCNGCGDTNYQKRLKDIGVNSYTKQYPSGMAIYIGNFSDKNDATKMMENIKDKLHDCNPRVISIK